MFRAKPNLGVALPATTINRSQIVVLAQGVLDVECCTSRPWRHKQRYTA